jgi:hypothetical protein
MTTMPAQGHRTSTPKKSLDCQRALFPTFFPKSYFLLNRHFYGIFTAPLTMVGYPDFVRVGQRLLPLVLSGKLNIPAICQNL